METLARAAVLTMEPVFQILRDATSHRRRWHAFLFVLLLLSLQHDAASALTFKIEPYLDECFLMHTPKIDVKLYISGSYEMVSDQSLSGEPILVYVMDGTTDELLYQSKPARGGRGNFQVPVQPSQKYWLCVQNSSHGPEDEDGEHPDHQPRTVGLRYRLEMNGEPAVDPLDPHNQKLATWLKHAGDVNRELSNLMDHFAYAKRRESDQREITESTFSEILTWTAVEAGAVCAVAVGQIFYFRMFLEKKRYM